MTLTRGFQYGGKSQSILPCARVSSQSLEAESIRIWDAFFSHLSCRALSPLFFRFGAKLNGSPQVNQCFQVGPPEAEGLSGILEAYRTVFKKKMRMSGPTDFCEAIACARIRADKAQVRSSCGSGP
jgi:hypothetical protein